MEGHPLDRDRRHPAARPLARQHRRAEVHLRHQPAAEDVAVRRWCRPAWRWSAGPSAPRGSSSLMRFLPSASRADVYKPAGAGPYRPADAARPAPPGRSEDAAHGLRQYRHDHPPRSRSRPARRSSRSTTAPDFDVRAKSDASPVTEADERADAMICRGLARSLPRRSRSSPRSSRRATASRRADLLPRRPARRHQGVRAAPRRLHRQHRADRERRADPRRRLRPGQGAALLHRRRRPLARGGRARRAGRRRRRSARCSVADARPRGAGRRRLQVAPRPGDRRLHRPLPGRRLPLGRLVAEVLPRRGRRGRPLPAARAHDGMGHRRRPGGAARRRRQGGALRRPRARSSTARPASRTRSSSPTPRASRSCRPERCRSSSSSRRATPRPAIPASRWSSCAARPARRAA